jgi:hypothetical protein
MAAKRKDTFDASFGLGQHALRIQTLGKVLLRQAATALGCTDLDDFESYDASRLDPDTMNTATKVFSAVSQQLASVSKLYEQISGQNREQQRETILVECLREVDPTLAERFLALYEEKLAKSSLGAGAD